MGATFLPQSAKWEVGVLLAIWLSYARRSASSYQMIQLRAWQICCLGPLSQAATQTNRIPAKSHWEKKGNSHRTLDATGKDSTHALIVWTRDHIRSFMLKQERGAVVRAHWRHQINRQTTWNAH